MRGIIITSAIGLGLGIAIAPVLAQTEQPAQGQEAKCPDGSQSATCPQPEGGAQQGTTPSPESQQGGENQGKADKPKAQQGQAEQPAAEPQKPTQGTETQQQPAKGGTAETQQQPAQGTETQQQPAQGSNTETQTQPAQGEQQQTEQGGKSAATNVNVTVEQKTEITQVIKEERVEPVRVDVDVAVGVAVPQTVKVKLRPLPVRIVKIVPAYEGYLFFILVDGRIVIVEPSTLKIVLILV
ncbi:DUF1236 domain-containing protein [Aminobacter aganoensis]|uniref:DUF1236 domain-containing protein n=1 Tax=Aminobacter aganoensis TaxID=83264 RepID=A0A7X0FCJ1_9HYPH|nr:DUF1236 domain-containing protein [Aminobacter aganoensis]MBB6357170.1 hypothetical protein [Aminobacter aganoensis]